MTIEDQIKQAVDSAKNILLHLHPRPDPDSVGSALAFYQVLKTLGKNPTIVSGDSPLPEHLSFLPGFDQIKNQTFAALEWAAFDLFIILDSSSLERVSEQVSLVLPPQLKTIVIDHHKTAEAFGQINLLKPEAAATAEMLFDLFTASKWSITQDVARCLFMGIWGDTGSFRYSNTSAHTFAIASQLSEIEPQLFKLIDAIENSQTAGRVLGQAIAVTGAERLLGGRVMLAATSQKAFQSTGASVHDSEGVGGAVANILKSIKGVVIGLSLLEEAPNQVKVSARSRDGAKWDVSRLVGSLGGGGHAAAAGATVAGDLATVRERVIAFLPTLYPDLAPSLASDGVDVQNHFR